MTESRCEKVHRRCEEVLRILNCAVSSSIRMFQPQCRCRIARGCVVIPQNRKDHIIRRHFTSPVNDPRRSFFLEDEITPEALFTTIIHKLRNGLQPVERGWRGRYVYYIQFSYIVGVFPFAPHARYTSNVKVICDYVVCQYCCRHCPSEVITAFPV